MGAIFLCFRLGGERAAAGGAAESPRPLARPALRAQTPLSLRDISPRSGESPFDKGAFFARAEPAREASPHRGGGRAAAMAGGALEVCGGGRYTGGMNPSPTGGPLKGGLTVGCGPGMPGPYRLPQMGCGREGQGRAAARPLCSGRELPGNGWRRKARRNPSGLASSASSPVRGAFCGLSPEMESIRYMLRGFGGTPEFKVEEGAGALRTDSNTASV